MLNAKRNFFIIVSNVYEAFDFSAPGFIQLLIRKAHLPRACFVGTRKDLTSNDTNKRGWGEVRERPPRRPCLKALAVASRPLQRPRRNDLLFHHEGHEAHGDIELGNQESRKWDFRERRQRRDG